MINKILIIGCGLIGSSLLKGIYSKKIARNIFIHEKSKKNISIIKKFKIPHTILNKLEENFVNFDMVIFCTPMSEYKKNILKLNKSLTSKTIVTDVGSTKVLTSQLVRKMLNKNVSWIPGHPISGSEVSGPKYGKKDLFKNKWCVLIKDKKVNKTHLFKLKKFWEKLGAKVVMMDSKQHDLIFSITSHLPHLIAYNLVKTATDFEKGKKFNLIKYSAGGLRDFSRIAASNEIMWRDIFFSNKINIITAINLFVKNLNSFKRDISRKKNNQIIKKLIDTKKVRKKIINLKQDIDKPDFGRF
tara:strand:+ start:296 stop:1195 length:900 start_codon:yes stop_codon:yes gene_type:complete